jgi:hypothetical protein
VWANLTALAEPASAVVADPEPEAAPTTSAVVADPEPETAPTTEAPVENVEMPTETPAATTAA